jgi:class 3 adenylate cyclase
VTILFTDVQNFTGIAEAAAPDVLMRQTSCHLAALTEAFLAEGGTVDKFIGDAVMVFWNAPICSPNMPSGPVVPPFRPKRQAKRSTPNSKPTDCRLSTFASAFMSATS